MAISSGNLKTNWGRWHLKTANQTLVHDDGQGHEYEVDLESMKDSAAMLDWIIQVNQKMWATREDVGHLVEALDHIFAPQQNLCSFGVGKTIDPKTFLAARPR